MSENLLLEEADEEKVNELYQKLIRAADGSQMGNVLVALIHSTGVTIAKMVMMAEHSQQHEYLKILMSSSIELLQVAVLDTVTQEEAKARERMQ